MVLAAEINAWSAMVAPLMVLKITSREMILDTQLWHVRRYRLEEH